MAEDQSVVITIPEDLSLDEREELGEMVVDFIVNRTQKGLNRFNKPFKQYSKSYSQHVDFKGSNKTKKVNLSLGGDMLTDLELLSQGPGFIRIGFSDKESNDKAFYNKENGREFMGISAKDLQRLIKKL